MEKKRVRVLVVDDELRNTKLVEAILSREGYDVVSAANGREALEAVASLHPDLILLDVMMPDMSGFEVAAELKRRPDATGIPIVMVTSLDDRTSKLRALDSGAEEFLTKPIDRAELLVRTRNLLRLKSYADIHANYARVLVV
ncbi:MAG TPA: response regulator, partial [Casimicrobiaceae bacterium]|nr:response regulator [Casimicrobiaceae bacterium]